jgi:hypothetical protein
MQFTKNKRKSIKMSANSVFMTKVIFWMRGCDYI